MNDLKLKMGCYQYDHTRALFDGTVKIDGIDATFESAPIVSQIFERMTQQRAFDVSELGLTYYLRTLESGDGAISPRRTQAKHGYDDSLV
jgi:hypothetical protein